MTGLVLYLATVLIWGSTWIAITFQLGSVDPSVSIAHRFMLAAALMFVWLGLRRQSVYLSSRQLMYVVIQAMCLFCINYHFVYMANGLITSGLVALVFSNIVILNIVFGAVFHGSPISPIVLLGAVLGLCGVATVFWPELGELSFSDQAFAGLFYSFCGTVLASLGNMAAVVNVRNQVPVLVTNAWGMFIGASCMYAFALWRGAEITVEVTTEYLGSLAFLAVFGSVAAFWCYITLIGRIGADKAGYANLLIPVVAILISTVVEGYQWTLLATAGLVLILAGNYLVMRTSRA